MTASEIVDESSSLLDGGDDKCNVEHILKLLAILKVIKKKFEVFKIFY